MSGASDTLDRFERVYSAASRMLYAQEAPAWREHPKWPEERKDAFGELEEVLLGVGRVPSGVGESSDPARHLISRRAAGGEDRPLSFGEAVTEWERRLTADPGPLVERWEPFHEWYMEPGACVLMASGWHLALTGAFWDVFTRMAPGRPAMTMGQDGDELSRVAHEAADALRAPLGVQTPTRRPGGESWISRTARWTAEVPDLEQRLEHLSQAAWRASETMPRPEELMGSKDFSVKMAAAKAAVSLRDLLAGRDVPAWRERRDGIDPTLHETLGLVSGGPTGERPLALRESADSWRDLFSGEREPWTPVTYRLPPESELGDTDWVISSAVALILAEVLDEFSARLYPGLRSEVLHFDVFTFGRFLHRFKPLV